MQFTLQLSNIEDPRRPVLVQQNKVRLVSPIHPIGNSLKKEKSMYRVLTPSIETSIYIP